MQFSRNRLTQWINLGFTVIFKRKFISNNLSSYLLVCHVLFCFYESITKYLQRNPKGQYLFRFDTSDKFWVDWDFPSVHRLQHWIVEGMGALGAIWFSGSLLEWYWGVYHFLPKRLGYCPLEFSLQEFAPLTVLF